MATSSNDTARLRDRFRRTSGGEGWDFSAAGRLPHPDQTLGGLLLSQSPRDPQTYAATTETPRPVAAATLT